MASNRLTDPAIPELDRAAPGDLLHVVDVSDPTDGPAGTSKRVAVENLIPPRGLAIDALDLTLAVERAYLDLAETDYLIGHATGLDAGATRRYSIQNLKRKIDGHACVSAWDSGCAFDGATDDGLNLKNWLASAAVPAGSTVKFPSNRTIILKNTPLVLPEKSLRFAGSGTRFLQLAPTSGALPTAITRKSQLGTAWDRVDAIAAVDHVGYVIRSVSRGVTRLTLATAANATNANYPAGYRVKIVSNDRLPDGTDNNNRCGDWATVIKADPANGFLYVTDVDTRHQGGAAWDTVNSNVRLCKPKDLRISFEGFTFEVDDAAASAATQNVSYMRLEGLMHASLHDCDLVRTAGPAFHPLGCAFAGQFDIRARHLKDQSWHLKDPVNGSHAVNGDYVSGLVGYAGNDSGCMVYHMDNTHVVDSRHAYSSNVQSIPDAQVNNAGIEVNFGRTSLVIVSNSSATGMGSTMFDTHAGAKNVLFSGIAGHGGAGNVIAARADNSQVIGLVAKKCQYVGQIFPAGNSRPRIAIDGAMIEDCGELQVLGGARAYLSNYRHTRSLTAAPKMFLVQHDAGLGLAGELHVAGHVRLDMERQSGTLIDLQAGAEFCVDPSGFLNLGQVGDWSAGTGPTIFSIQRSATFTARAFLGDDRFLVEGDGWGQLFSNYSGVDNVDIEGEVYGNAWLNASVPTGTADPWKRGRRIAPQNSRIVPGAYVAIAAAPAGANATAITFTAREGGAAVTRPTLLAITLADAATGAGLTATTPDGAVTTSAGAILSELTAKKAFLAQTNASGVFTLQVTDSAKTAYYPTATLFGEAQGQVAVGARLTNANYG